MANNWIKKWRVRKNDVSDYIVSIARDGSYGCSCPAWTLQRKECRHIKMVKGVIPKADYDITVTYDSALSVQAEHLKYASPRIDAGLAASEWDTKNQTVTYTEESLPLAEMTEAEADHLFGKSRAIRNAAKKLMEPELPSMMDLIRQNAQYGGSR